MGCPTQRCQLAPLVGTASGIVLLQTASLARQCIPRWCAPSGNEAAQATAWAAPTAPGHFLLLFVCSRDDAKPKRSKTRRRKGGEFMDASYRPVAALRAAWTSEERLPTPRPQLRRLNNKFSLPSSKKRHSTRVPFCFLRLFTCALMRDRNTGI